jgi:hypothetical protein
MVDDRSKARPRNVGLAKRNSQAQRSGTQQQPTEIDLRLQGGAP